MKNEIINEIHKIRKEHAKAFNYNIDEIIQDYQEKEKMHSSMKNKISISSEMKEKIKSLE